MSAAPDRGPLGWWRARLARRIVLPAVTVTLLFLAALGFVAFRLGQRAVIDQVEERNRQLAVQVGGEVAAFFQTQLDTLRLQGEALLDSPDPAAQGTALVRLRARFPYVFNDLRLFDGDGRETIAVSGPLSQVLADGAAPPVSPGRGDPDVDQALSARTLIVSPIDFRPISGSPFVTVTLPLARCAPEGPCLPAAALQAQIDLRSFWTRVDGFQIAEGAVTIVDQRGVVLAHPDRRRVGVPIDQAAIEPLFAGYEGTTSYAQAGATYLAAYAPVGQPLGWGVLVEQERGAALRLVGSIGLASAAATLLSAVSLTLLLSSLVRRSLRPVVALSEAAGRIAASGKPDASIAAAIPRTSTSAEIKNLADSFDQMIARLREAQDELRGSADKLERRVEERTAQLQTLLEVARVTSSSLERQTVLQILISQIDRLVPCDAATVRLLDPAREQLETVAAIGHGANALARRLPLASAGILAAVVGERAPRLVGDTSADPAWRATFGPEAHTGSWLGVPLLVQDRATGVISVYREGVRRYSAEDAAMLSALAAQVGIALSHARLYEESVRRVERELDVARQIQQHLFPEQAPTMAGLDMATFYKPARETTGDFYAFVSPRRAALADGGAAGELVDLFIGDVSGKSLPAALLMAMARTALYAAARGEPSEPAATLRQANAVLYGEMPRGSFVASTYARFDGGAGAVTLVNAAQPAPLLVRGGAAALLEGPGAHLPLGVVEQPDYQPLQVALRPGDLLLFYTDGVIEAFSPERELFGFEQLQAAAAACPPEASAAEVVESLISAVIAWMGEAPQNDDIALVAVRVTEGWPRRG